MTARLRASAAALALAGAPLVAAAGAPAPPIAAGDPSDGEAAPVHGAWPWRFELKHLRTDGGAIDETTRTILRVEKLVDASVALFRVDVPWVEERVAGGSDPLEAGLGDVKARVGLRAVRAGRGHLTPFLEVVAPTAETRALGSGKWQLAPGATASFPLAAPWSGPTRATRLVPKLQQYVAIAGDPVREDVSYTSLELKLEAQWERVVLSVNPKPVVDWTAGFDTAAVVELQATWILSPAWRLSARPGVRLWGPRLPATYDRQLELAVRLTL